MFSSKTLALLGLLVPFTLAQYGGAPAPVVSTPTKTAVGAAVAASSGTSTSSAASNTQTIVAGMGGITDLSFTPSSIVAAPGSFVEFQFMALNHSVAASAFASPCSPINSSFYAGFNFATKTGTASNVFTLAINNTDPVWFYCPQTVAGIHHCVAGMVGVINPPTGKTQADFAATAAKASTAIVPAQVQGGIVGPAKAASSGSASSSASAASSTPTGSASQITVGMGFMGLVGIGFSALLSF
jgi:plastocyanin